MNPRQHPTGIIAALTTILVVICNEAGVDLGADDAALIVGAVAAIVSLFTPRQV